MNGYIIHNKPLYVAVAMRKEERKNQLELQFNQRYSTNIGQVGLQNEYHIIFILG